MGAARSRRCTGPVARPMRWRRTGGSARGWPTSSALEPGPRLRELERQILEHDPSLQIAARAPAGNLPSLSADLVGRDSGDRRAGGPARARTARRDRRAGRDRQDRARDRDRPATDRRPVGSGWPGSRRRRPPTRCSTRSSPPCGVTGGEAALLERLKGPAAVVILDNCEHVLDAAAALAVGLLDAAPGLRILCTSQAPLDVDGEARVRARRRSRSPTRSSCSPARARRTGAAPVTRCTTCAARWTACRWRSSSRRRARRRCRSRRSPAGSTIASAC